MGSIITPKILEKQVYRGLMGPLPLTILLEQIHLH